MSNELKNLQNVQLEILDEIVRICNKYDIPYFFIGGTLLGAVRHKGFIPWDDDIDIGMLRKDYNKFIKLCKDELKSEYYLQCSETYPQHWLSFAKIRKNNTLFIESEGLPFRGNDHRGIFVDIFPYDYVSKNKNIQKIQYSLNRKIDVTISIKHKNDYIFNLYQKQSERGVKAFIKFKCLTLLPYSFLHLLQKQISTFCFEKNKYPSDKLCGVEDCCVKTLSKTGEQINHTPHPVVLNQKEFKNDLNTWCGTMEYWKEIFPFDVFFPLIKLEFEGKFYYVPNKWDVWLQQMYGDYMQFPPEEQRGTHHKSVVFNTTQK
jgi:lipopolysaccharide cholinephosphotransferase